MLGFDCFKSGGACVENSGGGVGIGGIEGIEGSRLVEVGVGTGGNVGSSPGGIGVGVWFSFSGKGSFFCFLGT